MAITASDVRAYLNDVSTNLIPNATIEKQIEVAEHKVDKNKSSSALQQDIDNAVLVWAGFLTFNAYISTIARGPEGNVPAGVQRYVDTYKEIAEEFLEYVKRGGVTTAAKPVAKPVIIDSIIDWKE